MITVKFDRGELDNNIDALKENLSFHELEIIKTIHDKSVQIKNMVMELPWDENKKKEANVRTELVLSALRELGQRFGYSTKNYYGQKDWLFDLIWLVDRERSWETQFERPNKEKTWENFERIKLACESEVIGDVPHILEDFAKLTIAKADYRLFIHSNQYFDPSRANTVDICKAIIPYSAGDRYLFVGFDLYCKSKEFRVDFIQA